MKRVAARPEDTRAKRRAAAIAAWGRPEIREKRRTGMNRPEVRAQHSAAAKASWQNPAVMLKRAQGMIARAEKVRADTEQETP